jgi:hypothetical protein
MNTSTGKTTAPSPAVIAVLKLNFFKNLVTTEPRYMSQRMLTVIIKITLTLSIFRESSNYIPAENGCRSAVTDLQVAIEKRQDPLTVAGPIDFIEIHMFGPRSDPKLLGFDGGIKEGLGFDEGRMLVEATGD